MLGPKLKGVFEYNEITNGLHSLEEWMVFCSMCARSDIEKTTCTNFIIITDTNNEIVEIGKDEKGNLLI